MAFFNQYYKWFLRFFVFCIFCVICMTTSFAAENKRHFPAGSEEVFLPANPFVRTDLLKNISVIVKKSIDQGYYPGAVILVAHQGNIIYRGVFGNRRIIPDMAPMRFDTIFDLASLTKVVATTPSIMQLVEQGKLDLDAPVSKFWPAFANNGKGKITIRELLTHTSGLPTGLFESFKGKEQALQLIEKIKLMFTPGTSFSYSDINFIVLANIVERITGERFENYTQTHIFKPLAMTHTQFLPPKELKDSIAPTEKIDDTLRWGQVHDPESYAMGGVSGNAGLFSNAEDLGKFAQYLLDIENEDCQLSIPLSKTILSPLAVLKMTTPQTPPAIKDIRGFGWDIDSRYSNRGTFFPVSSYGHSGWTGTSIWIDPYSQTWIIILTSRTHPTPAKQNQLIKDRQIIANIVAASLADVPIYTQSDPVVPGFAGIANNTGLGELHRAYD